MISVGIESHVQEARRASIAVDRGVDGRYSSTRINSITSKVIVMRRVGACANPGHTGKAPVARARARDAKPDPQSFGRLLRTWRTARRYSQLELAELTQVSQRHLSFLESGRAGPSRDMVMQVSRALQVPLRERNELLLAAGFAPLYPERGLDDGGMSAIRQALEATLTHHEPFPALVVDRQWNVVMHNAAVDRLIGLLGPPARVWKKVDPSGNRNLMRLSLHPHGLQPLVVDWPQTAGALLARLQVEVQANPANLGLQALLSELRELPGVPVESDMGAMTTMQLPVLTLKLRQAGATLEMFSMVCTFGSALDLTADELRLELLFPSNGFTAQFLRSTGSIGNEASQLKASTGAASESARKRIRAEVPAREVQEMLGSRRAPASGPGRDCELATGPGN
jgi:transcriptional regulator with XRE-family HTH domain